MVETEAPQPHMVDVAIGLVALLTGGIKVRLPPAASGPNGWESPQPSEKLAVAGMRSGGSPITMAISLPSVRVIAGASANGTSSPST